MSGQVSPPRWAETLLRLAAPDADREVLRDELRDEFEREVARRGERAARVWFAREVLASLVSILARRVAVARRRTGRRGGSMDSWMQDVRFGARVLAKNPGFTAVAVVTLALGVGANTAVFSVVDAVLLRALPFRAAERLVAIGQTEAADRESLQQFSFRNYADLRARTKAFDDLAAYYPNSVSLTGEGEAVRLRGVVATASLFPLLGALPELGRPFLAVEDGAGGGPQGRPAILGWDCWQRRFGGSPQVLGRSIRLDGDAYTVVGVMPRAFSFPIQQQPAEIWLSPARDAERQGDGAIMVARGYRGWRVVGRLKEGATLELARAEANVVAESLARQYPDADRDLGFAILPLRDWVVGNQRLTLLLLFATVGVMLLIACSNFAHLLFERAVRRRREITLRLALGASRWRVARQLVTEILMLAAMGGAVGCVLGACGTTLLVSLSPDGIPRIAEAGLDARVLAFTALVSLLTGGLFGLAPALGASRLGLAESLKEGGRGGTSGRRAGRARSLLIVGEVALALALLVGAGLLLRTLQQLQEVALGFNPRGVLTMTVAKSATGLDTGEFFRRLVERVRGLPGVADAGVTWQLPLSGAGASTGLEIQGQPDDPEHQPMAVLHSAGPGYFRTMGIPILRGRDFDDHDDLRSAPVLIVNETLAKRFFPGGDALGKHITPGFSTTGDRNPREIVGVVGDVKHHGPRSATRLEFYFAQAQMPVTAMTLVVRTEGDPHTLAGPVRRTVRAMDADAPVFSVASAEDYMARSLAPTRFTMTLLTVFAILALVMTAVGLYGVISFSVSQSARDLGIRAALGAGAGDTLRLVMGKGLRLTLVGVVLGLAIALGASRVMAGLVFGVGTTDPATYAGVALLLLAVSALACYLPARRAARVDPMVVLRCD